MLISMTGFGRAEGIYNDKHITVELRSLNSKSPDLRIRQPLPYRVYEARLRKYVLGRLQRGKIEITIEVLTDGSDDEYSLNHQLFRKHYQDLKATCDDLEIKQGDLVQAIMRIPKVVAPTSNLADEKEWDAVMEVVARTVDAHHAHRQAEGQAMYEACQQHVHQIAALLDEVSPLETEREQQMRDKLYKNVAALVPNDPFNADRYEQEVLYHLEKLDISEEKNRLAQHCDYFRETLQSDRFQKGRKLNFISQEMGREINTLGAKANFSDIQHIVVRMKDELEKIKEMLANVV